MQVDPIRPKLKVPGTKRLKLKYDNLLSSFAFNFNLRRYILVVDIACGESCPGQERPALFVAAVALVCCLPAGAYTRPLFGST